MEKLKQYLTPINIFIASIVLTIAIYAISGGFSANDESTVPKTTKPSTGSGGGGNNSGSGSGEPDTGTETKGEPKPTPYSEGTKLYIKQTADTEKFGGAKRREEAEDPNRWKKIPVGELVGISTGKVVYANGIWFQELKDDSFWNPSDYYVAHKYLTTK